MPGKVHFFQSCCHTLPSAEPWEVSLCCAARMLLSPFWRHTGQVSAHSARYFQFHLHRALLFHCRKSGKGDSALPLAQNHNSWHPVRHCCLGCAQKTPVHPQNSSWACLPLKNIMLSLLLMPFGLRFMKKIISELISTHLYIYSHLRGLGELDVNGCWWNSNSVLVLEFRASFLGLGVPD